MERKLAHVQALRGVACLMVVLQHLWVLEHAFGYATPGLAAVRWFGFAGVDLFFVLSGFIITAANRRHLGRPSAVPGFLARRLWRIYPPYWAALGVAAATAAGLMGWAVFDGCPPGSWAAWVALAPAGPHNLFVGQAWTLTYELMFYLAFGLLMLAPPRAAGWALAGWGGAVVALAPADPATPAEYLVSPFVLEFLGGCLIAVLVARGVCGYWRAALAAGVGYAAAGAALAAAAATVPYHDAMVSQRLRVAVFGPAAVLVVYAAVAAEGRVRWRVPGGLVRVGDASYALYLIHPVVMMAGLVVGFLVPHTRLTHVAWLAGTFAAAVAAGLVFHAAVEKPLLRLARRRPAAPPATPAPVERRAAA